MIRVFSTSPGLVTITFEAGAEFPGAVSLRMNIQFN
jgi:hypothetical protein